MGYAVPVGVWLGDLYESGLNLGEGPRGITGPYIKSQLDQVELFQGSGCCSQAFFEIAAVVHP